MTRRPGPRERLAEAGVIGIVYLLHLDPGLRVTGGRVVRHYIGWTAGENVQQRLDQHLAGRGSPLVAAVLTAGGTVTLTRTWPQVDRHFERRLKRRHEAPRLCPRCVAAGHTNGRGLLLTNHSAPADEDSAGAGAPHRRQRRCTGQSRVRRCCRSSRVITTDHRLTLKRQHSGSERRAALNG